MTARAGLFAAGALGALVACDGAPPAPTPPDLPTPAVSVTITSPSDGQQATTPAVLVEGTYAPDKLEDSIWLLVWPERARGVGWPQSPNAAAGLPAEKDSATRRWSVTATLGGPPQSYTLRAYTANAAAANNLSSTLIRWVADEGDFPGLTVAQLPEGLTERYSIRITRGALARINSPADGSSTTATVITAAGTFAPGLNDDIWLFVWPELSPDRGWPQSPNASAGLPAARNTARLEWSSPASLGGPPQAYDLAVYTASRAASNTLRDLLMEGARTGNHLGLTTAELPGGLAEQERIRIRRE